MIVENLLVWNVRGLNSRARRNAVGELVSQERVSLISLQETKLDACDDVLVRQMLGSLFDFVALPACNTCGGILLAWRRDTWTVSNTSFRNFSLTAKVMHCATGDEWWITCVYGPQLDHEKTMFLDELNSIRLGCPDKWLVWGDFNLIYKAEDKSNGRLNRRLMGQFRRCIDDNELIELHLNGRRFTWSNERDNPTLERLDRVFASDEWSIAFPDHNLSALATECSDHAPLLLRTDCALPHFKRFRFENFWTKCEGYLQTVEQAWNAPLPWPQADAFRVLDYKLRATARALSSWSAKQVGSVRLQLAIAKEITLRLDCAQESRTLAAHELALRRKAKLCSLGLASLQRSMVRQRSRITFLAEGDANTKFFHLQACHRSRKNHIASIRVQEVELTEDKDKADAFFRHFEAVLGSPGTRGASLNLSALGLPNLGDAQLDYCFSEEEVRQTMLDIPVDKAPGPDGFTGEFYRSAWSIIKHDILRAFHALWALDGRSLYLVNQAYIVLLRKKPEACLVGDFRPISLIHSFIKLFTKVLANRLAPQMNLLVKTNQSAFIRGRVLHDNFKGAQLTAKLLHKKKKASALLKIDISKAFDSIDWRFLLGLLAHMGFSRRWLNWISLLLSSASTKIICNGSPGRRICHARGLRQGDPLSLLLFVLGMEALNALFKLAETRGLFTYLDSRITDRAFLYADDVILFCAARQQDLVVARGILDLFAAASGLHSNIKKCLVTPIQCGLEETVTLVRFFPAKLSPLPITYLGIPLAVGHLKKSTLQPLVDKVAGCLPAWKAKFLSKAGRCVLVKTTLSAIPVHTALAITISPWVIQCIDKLRRAFLWAGTDTVSGGKCSVAWPKVCRPPDLGGLGLIDLEIFGYALRMRWLWFKKTDGSRPWASLPDKSEGLVDAMFQVSVSVEIGNGQRALFWLDRWLQGKSISELAPCLFNAVGPRVVKHRTVEEGLLNNNWARDISGALTVQVILDYLLVWELTRSVHLMPEMPDRFIWKWTSDHNFSTASAYRAFFIGQTEIQGAKLLTKARAPNKCKFFMWLVLHDRCWTAARRKRHGLQEDDTCILCAQEVESISHLLVRCVFAREVWHRVLSRLGWHTLDPLNGCYDLASWWSSSRKKLQKDDRKCFDSLVLLTSWTIWLERNRRTFDHQSRSVFEVTSGLEDEAVTWGLAGHSSITSFVVALGRSFGRFLVHM